MPKKRAEDMANRKISLSITINREVYDHMLEMVQLTNKYQSALFERAFADYYKEHIDEVRKASELGLYI